MDLKHLYFIKFMYNIIKVKNFASDNFFFLAENFCLVDDRVFLLSISWSQFVLKGPAKFLKHGEHIKFLWTK